jgi:hypothetical protein
MTAVRTAILVLLALAAWSGCVTVRSSTSPSADLGRYHTFAWQPAATRYDATFERSPAGELVRERIARALWQRGIRETSERPDFRVAYRTRFVERREVGDWGYPAFFWGPPGPVTIDEYTEGTLSIDFVDASSGKVFWSGAAAAVVDERASPDMHKLASSFDKVMKRYPATVASAAPRQTM